MIAKDFPVTQMVYDAVSTLESLSEKVGELEARLRKEQSCNYCHQYHGKDVCETLLKTVERLKAKNKVLTDEIKQVEKVSEERLFMMTQAKTLLKTGELE
jgi:Zn-finger protein